MKFQSSSFLLLLSTPALTTAFVGSGNAFVRTRKSFRYGTHRARKPSLLFLDPFLSHLLSPCLFLNFYVICFSRLSPFLIYYRSNQQHYVNSLSLCSCNIHNHHIVECGTSSRRNWDGYRFVSWEYIR